MKHVYKINIITMITTGLLLVLRIYRRLNGISKDFEEFNGIKRLIDRRTVKQDMRVITNTI